MKGMVMPIQTRRVTIRAPGGDMPAFLAEPSGARGAPGVVVLMEAFGLVPSIESVARRLAEEGYVALAPDLFYREAPHSTAPYDDIPRAIELMTRLVQLGPKFLDDVAAAFDCLEAMPNVAPKKFGVIGFCMGGAFAFAAACAFPERVAAAAPFYGGGIGNLLDRAERIAAPLYLFFAEQDGFIPLDEVRRIEAKLTELGKDFLLKVYPGTDHGFFNDAREVYAPEAAADAWREVKRFFAAHLPRRA
jgi:carboxymethylenebutenolidase